MLEQNYSVKFVIGHAIFVGAICITLIALQIVMIVNKYPLYYVGTGIWVSAYFIILISLSLLISKYKLFGFILIKQFNLFHYFKSKKGIIAYSLSH